MKTLPRILALLLCASAFLAVAAPERAEARQLKVGLSDLSWELNAWTGDMQKTMAHAKFFGADVIRVNVAWYRVAPTRPLFPSVSSSPGYNWHRLDAVIREAQALGLEPHLTIYGAPIWAQKGPAADVFFRNQGSWIPNPTAVQGFARAIATRYSGTFPDPWFPGRFLPRVRAYEAWNEQNWSNYLAPQLFGPVKSGPAQYRPILNAFYAGIHSADPLQGLPNIVVAGGTAPTEGAAKRTLANGRKVPKRGTLYHNTRPLDFWREVFCLNSKLVRKGPKCPTGAARPHFDVLAHHPINLLKGGFDHGRHPDDVMIADMPDLIKTLRRAEAAGTVAGGTHPVWATEMWWETNPPDKKRGIGLMRQARYMQTSLYQLDRFGVDRGYFLQVRDTPRVPQDDYQAFHSYQTGILFSDWTPKPSTSAIFFPFVSVETPTPGVMRLWSIPPRSGPLQLQRRSPGGEWQTVATVNATAGDSFSRELRMPAGMYEFRALQDTVASLPFAARVRG